MEIELRSGMASVYFATDPKKGIAALSKPRVIICGKTLSIKLLSEIFANSFNASLSRGFFRALIKKAEAKDIAALMEGLAQDRKPTAAVIGFTLMPFIISKGIEKSCLTALKIIKIRGYGQPLAINILSENIDDQILKLKEELKGKILFEDDLVSVYDPGKLEVVSNRDKTIISTERSIKDIVKNRHDLVVGPVNNEAFDLQAFLGEGHYN